MSLADGSRLAGARVTIKTRYFRSTGTGGDSEGVCVPESETLVTTHTSANGSYRRRFDVAYPEPADAYVTLIVTPPLESGLPETRVEGPVIRLLLRDQDVPRYRVDITVGSRTE